MIHTWLGCLIYSSLDAEGTSSKPPRPTRVHAHTLSVHTLCPGVHVLQAGLEQATLQAAQGKALLVEGFGGMLGTGQGLLLSPVVTPAFSESCCPAAHETGCAPPQCMQSLGTDAAHT